MLAGFGHQPARVRIRPVVRWIRPDVRCPRSWTPRLAPACP